MMGIKTIFGMNGNRILIWVVAFAILAAAPLYFSPLSTLFAVLVWITLAESFNIFTGLTGYVNFGFVVFYGVGGYASGLLMTNLNISPYAAVAVGGIASAALALVASAPILRLRGAYFAIAMLVIGQAFLVTFANWNAVGSAIGFTLPISYFQPLAQYYTILMLAAASVIVIRLMMRSRIGLALEGIKEQENTATSVGVNSLTYKTIALTISAFLAGAAGATSFWNIMIIDPPSAFDISVTIMVIAMVMLGGVGTIIGPIIGGAILYEVSNYLSLGYPSIHLTILGVVIMIVVLLIPDGLIGFLKRRQSKGATKRNSIWKMF